MKPKVLLIPENYPTASNPVAGIFIQDQIKALLPHYEISVFNSNPWFRGDYKLMENVQFFDFHLLSRKPSTVVKPFVYPLWEVQSLQLAKRIPKPDIIHLHGASLRGGWVKKLAAHWGTPFVVTEHTGPWSAISNRKMLFKRVKNVLENAAAVWPVSNHLKKEMAESGVTINNVSPIANPVDTELFSLRESSLSSEKTILFIGRLDHFKGGMRTLRAFHKVANRIPDFNLCIAGDGAEANEIVDYVSANDLSARVKFVNRVLSRTEMKQYFHRACFLVFPSEFESFGLVGIEAMSTGLPVVLTNQTGPLDYANEDATLLVNPNSEPEISKAMVQMATDIEKYNPETIRAHVVAHFSFEAYATKVAKEYMSIISA